MPDPAPPTSSTVPRQIVLPLSKAIEIAWKSIRMRLSRSLLVTSGIVLALAFLMAILTQQALIEGMRQWAQTAGASPRFRGLRERQRELESRVKSLQAPLVVAVEKGQPRSTTRPVFDPKTAYGKEWPELQQDLGLLPAPAGDLSVVFSNDPNLVETMRRWIDARRDLKGVVDLLNGPQNLDALLHANGVPTTPAEAAAGRVQTRWLLGLALLVAFVGILNAMLMSVTERFREIGTMKCLGALDSFIVKLFLIESLFQGVAGTLAGIVAGLLLSIASAWSAYPAFLWKNAPWGSIALSAALCLLVGVGLTVAGAVYPAWQAARMQPIEAMRVET